MEYGIGAFARRTGIVVHTLRYYERLGLLTPARDAAGRRRYKEADLAWAAFLLRLKATDMPLREMQRYAALRAEGDMTLEARLALLLDHRTALRARMQALEEHMAALDRKIDHYRGVIFPKTGCSGPENCGILVAQPAAPASLANGRE